MKRTLIAVVLSCATFGAEPVLAGFSELDGRWISETIVVEGAPKCAPDAIALDVRSSSSGADVAISAGPEVSIKTRFASGKETAVFVEESGWMKRFGLSDATTRDALINQDPLLWARETETGAIIYRARITSGGGLNIVRVALEPVDGAVAATIEISKGDCRVGPFTTSLSPQ